MKSSERAKMGLVLMLSLLPLGGLSDCAGAVLGAGAGAAGGIAYTDRGAKGDVNGKMDAVRKDAQSAFKDLKIQQTAMSSKTNQQQLEGKTGNKTVTVTLTPAQGNTTHVEVVAREGTLKWNKDYAKKVLGDIVKKG